MSLKSLVSALTLAVGMVAFADPMGAQPTVERGKWCSDFPAARAYAEANNIPMLVFWANPGCSQCVKLENACKADDFVAWQAQRQMVMVFAYGKTSKEQKAAYDWITSVQKIKKFPFIGVYWASNAKGATVSSVFVGRKGMMPVTAGTLQEQLMNSVDQLTEGWNPGGVTPTPEPTPAASYTVTFVVDSSKASYSGTLVQTVVAGGSAVAPYVTTKDGWTFTGWDKSYENVTESTTVTAKFLEASRDVRPEAYGSVKKLSALVVNKTLMNYAGTAAISMGRINAQNKVKVTVKLSLFDGKTYSANYTAPVEVDGSMKGSLSFKTLGAMSFTVSYDAGVYKFETEGDAYEIEQAEGSIGGVIAAERLEFSPNMSGIAPEGYEFVSEAFPLDEPIYVKNGTKWSFDKVPTLKYTRVDGEYVLTGLDDEEKTNRAGLKLTYKSSTGIFSGTCKVYATNESSVAEGKKPTLKKYTANIRGAVVNGVGYGLVVIKIGGTSYTGTCEIK